MNNVNTLLCCMFCCCYLKEEAKKASRINTFYELTKLYVYRARKLSYKCTFKFLIYNQNINFIDCSFLNEAG